MKKECNSFFRNGYPELLARVLLGGVFVYASIHKISDPQGFARIVFGYDLFPHMAINLIAIILPFIELYAGLAMILGVYPRSAAMIINAMLFFFIAAIAFNLARGHEFDCGCFSIGESGYASSAGRLLLRNFILLSIGISILLYNGQRRLCIYSRHAGSNSGRPHSGG